MSGPNEQLDEREVCVGLRTRTEPGGRVVVYSRDRERYLFTNARGLAAIRAFQTGVTLSAHAHDVAAAADVVAPVATQSLVSFLRVLAGSDTASASRPEDETLPTVWTLEEELGASLERCETFGMPL
jgi:hypothetical protein